MNQIEDFPWLVLSLIVEHLDPVSSYNFHLTCSTIDDKVPNYLWQNKLIDWALELGIGPDQMLHRVIDLNLESMVIPILRRFRSFIDINTYNQIVAYAGHQKQWDIGNIICGFDRSETEDESNYFKEISLLSPGNKTVVICQKIDNRIDYLFDQYLKGKYVRPRLRFYLQKVLSTKFFSQYRTDWAAYHQGGKDLDESEMVKRAKEYVKYYLEHPETFHPLPSD